MRAPSRYQRRCWSERQGLAALEASCSVQITPTLPRRFIVQTAGRQCVRIVFRPMNLRFCALNANKKARRARLLHLPRSFHDRILLLEEIFRFHPCRQRLDIPTARRVFLCCWASSLESVRFAMETTLKLFCRFWFLGAWFPCQVRVKPETSAPFSES